MSRLLVLAVVGFVVYWLLKSYRKQLLHRDDAVPPPAEDMVRCEQCGVHLPKHESMFTGGKYFCSEEHLRLYSEDQNKT